MVRATVGRGHAVDPIALEPVDEVVVTVLMDNSYDGLMTDLGPGRRARLDRLPTVPAPQFEEGRTYPGLRAEHGFAALVIVRRGATGAAFEPIIEPTVTAFADLAPARTARVGRPSTGSPRRCPTPSSPTRSARPTRSRPRRTGRPRHSDAGPAGGPACP